MSLRGIRRYVHRGTRTPAELLDEGDGAEARSPLRLAGIRAVSPRVWCHESVSTRSESYLSLCRKWRSRYGNDSAHCHTVTWGNLCSTGGAAVSASRCALHDGHARLPLHENTIRKSRLQPLQWIKSPAANGRGFSENYRWHSASGAAVFKGWYQPLRTNSRGARW